MRTLLELTRGLLITVIAILTVLGGLFLALNESNVGPAAAATAIALVTRPPTETLFVPSPIVPTFVRQDGVTAQMPDHLATQSPDSPTSTPCPPPAGWIPITVNDSLITLAAQHGVSIQVVLQANCLATDSVLAGSILGDHCSPISG